jgi:hypothetical protein
MSATVEVLEMGVTAAEFFRCLPPALHGLAWRLENDVVTAEGAALCVRILVEPQPDRRLGLIRLPVTRVTLETAGAPAARAAFRARFDRAFQRAGG